KPLGSGVEDGVPDPAGTGRSVARPGVAEQSRRRAAGRDEYPVGQGLDGGEAVYGATEDRDAGLPGAVGEDGEAGRRQRVPATPQARGVKRRFASPGSTARTRAPATPLAAVPAPPGSRSATRAPASASSAAAARPTTPAPTTATSKPFTRAGGARGETCQPSG